MNLVVRGVATDAAAAAMATSAALRSLEAVGIEPLTIWIAHGFARFDATAAWDHGIALVRVSGAEASAAARVTAEAVGAWVVIRAEDLGRLGNARGDGARLAARHELGLWPDEAVDVVLGADRQLAALVTRLDAFDERLVAEPWVPQRLVLAALTTHGPALGEPMIRAILHPRTLVEVGPSDQATLDLIGAAAGPVTAA